jgi:RNA 2',3'-cyclic 3'-phosphodiesterase
MPTTTDRPRRLRTFVAIGLPEAIRQEISTRLTAAPVPSDKPIDVDRLHLTLFFLGATLPSQLSSIRPAMETVAEGTRRFELSLHGVHAFPDERSPHTVWLGVSAEPQDLGALRKLAAAVRRALQPLGFQESPRDFTPHMTLSRSRSGSEGTRLLSELRPVFAEPIGPMKVDSMALFNSQTLPSGPRYTELATFPLG